MDVPLTPEVLSNGVLDALFRWSSPPNFPWLWGH